MEGKMKSSRDMVRREVDVNLSILKALRKLIGKIKDVVQA